MNTVNSSLIERWIEHAGVNGEAKLAVESGVSQSLIGRARRGEAPKKLSTRIKLSKALGLDESVLFPPVKNDEEEAS